ncbi:hypothetical protein [Piscinibacterium candidicorallinum]
MNARTLRAFLREAQIVDPASMRLSKAKCLKSRMGQAENPSE